MLFMCLYSRHRPCLGLLLRSKSLPVVVAVLFSESYSSYFVPKVTSFYANGLTVPGEVVLLLDITTSFCV